MSDLSIVVVSHETRELTLSCLARIESELRSLDTPRRVDVTLVDNGSRDGTAEAVRSRFPEVDVIALPDNVGFAAGNNAALARVTGRIVGLINTDVEIEREAVERCLAAFELGPDVGIVGPQLRHADGRLQNSVHAFPGLVSELVPSWLLELALPSRFPSKRRLPDGPIEVDAVLGAAMFVRGSALEATGRLCEDYFFFLEETDLCWRMRDAGFRVLLEPNARLVHSSGASSKRRDAAATRIEYHRSLYRFLERRRGRWTRSIVRSIRTLRALPQLAALAAAAPFSSRSRERFAERSTLLRWHLSGCPDGPGLRQLAEPRRDD